MDQSDEPKCWEQANGDEGNRIDVFKPNGLNKLIEDLNDAHIYMHRTHQFTMIIFKVTLHVFPSISQGLYTMGFIRDDLVDNFRDLYREGIEETERRGVCLRQT